MFLFSSEAGKTLINWAKVRVSSRSFKNYIFTVYFLMGKLQVGIFFSYETFIAPTLRLPDFTSTKAARIKLWISLPCFIATHCITAPWVTGPANTYIYSQNKAWGKVFAEQTLC